MTTQQEFATGFQEAVDRTLEIAATWIGWDGRPRVSEGSTWTPHKAFRRTIDHLIDHLTQFDCLARGVPPPDGAWLGRAVTTDADWARFTEVDLNEARERLIRLAHLTLARTGSFREADWIVKDGDAWSPSELAEHVMPISWYAEQMGTLSPLPGADDAAR